MRRTIGSIINPSWSYDLEASLRAHRMLVKRSLDSKWRFKNQWVTTGPLETLMGFHSCGSSYGSTSWCTLGLYVRDGYESMTATLNKNILKALCSYPAFGSLAECIPDQELLHCDEAVQALNRYDCSRTREQMNRYHKRARLVKNVRLACCDSCVCLSADVSFNTKPTESRWDLYQLADEEPPIWNERLRLRTWLARAEKSLGKFVHPKNSPRTKRGRAFDPTSASCAGGRGGR